MLYQKSVCYVWKNMCTREDININNFHTKKVPKEVQLKREAIVDFDLEILM